MKKTYKNFQDYSMNDPKYLMRVLKGELHKTQAKITFEDGSYYNVTRAGSRWWGKNQMLHRDDGPCGIFPDGRRCFYLEMKDYTEEDYWEEVEKRKIA
jgi:hypothetical protein